MTGPRLVLSLTLVATFVGAFASADDGFQKASVVKQRRGFAKATVAAPDPVVRWVGVEEEQPKATDALLKASVPRPDNAAYRATTSVATPQVANGYEEEVVPPETPVVTKAAPINFVAPQAIAGQCRGGCGEPQCVQCQPVCTPACVQCQQASCDGCGGMAEHPSQKRRRFRLFRRRPRDGARQRTASKRHRRRWWPWLATNDMPAPQECGCASCSGVAVSQQAGVLVAPVQVAPVQSPVARHQFTVLSDMAGETTPVSDEQLFERVEPARPLTKKPSRGIRRVPLMNLDQAEDVMPTSLAKRIQRVTQRTTKAAGRQIRRASGRFESHFSEKSESATPQGFGEWTTGSK